MERHSRLPWLAVPLTAAALTVVVAYLVWASTSSADRAVASTRPLVNAIEAAIDSDGFAPLSLHDLGTTSDGNASFYNGHRILYIPDGRHFSLGIVVSDDLILKYDSRNRSWHDH